MIKGGDSRCVDAECTDADAGNCGWDPGELNSLLYKFQYTRENSAGPVWRGVNY